MTTVKEKYGELRIYASIAQDDLEKYISILVDVINKFPGLENYMTGMSDGIPVIKVFDGDKVQCEEFMDKEGDATDEELWEIYNKYRTLNGENKW